MKWISMTLILLLLCAGCIPKSPIEKLGIITAMGFDELEGDKMKGTLVMFQFDPTTSQTSQTVTSEAHTSKGIRNEANQKTSHKLVSGQIRLKVYQDQLASKGLLRYLDTVTRDAKMLPLAYLSVSDVPTSQLLRAEISEDAPNIGKYIERLIEKSITNEMSPDATVVTFLRDYHDIGVDPTLPLLSLEEQRVFIKGLGLFQDDRYVGTLTDEDIFYLLLLQKNLKIGQLQIELPESSMEKYYKKEAADNETEGSLHVSIHKVDSKVKIKPKKNDPSSFKVNLTMRTRLLEVSKSVDLSEKKTIDSLEKQIEKQIEKRMSALIQEFKEKQVDPVGFGLKYNTITRKDRLTNESWRDQIPNMSVDFNVDVKLLRHGITE
ncbi:Ger(x)C family spore germination protein [Halobacillus yeomjeoni]|uniref:Ger(X)C family spore germination protein n=1 Tax=Halobacillus yeomjeoni TaxID=311194 RepID=A0A931HSM3_9BACI|nr:Ger(x)C family spore germination protein [Halobacillus yeomjeoni]MBH0228633.1 Ger(x)C family spore germination protein [Halobacillus yeomjeoni]